MCLLFAGCSSLHGSRDEQDRWWALDKAEHFTFSAASGAATTWTARVAGAQPVPAAAAGFSLTLTGGLLKELWDATAPDGSGWSWKDLVFDLAGAATGTWAATQIPTP